MTGCRDRPSEVLEAAGRFLRQVLISRGLRRSVRLASSATDLIRTADPFPFLDL
jgi:hypothetical protein